MPADSEQPDRPRTGPCPHGASPRQCYTCELEARIESLEQALQRIVNLTHTGGLRDIALNALKGAAQ